MAKVPDMEILDKRSVPSRTNGLGLLSIQILDISYSILRPRL